MFKFVISAKTFNSFVRRVGSLSSSDKDSTIYFSIKNKIVEVFYQTKLDKSDSISLFHEKLPLLEVVGEGDAAIYLADLISIKLPDNQDEERFPRCNNVEFSFTQSILNIKYGIIWHKDTKPSNTKLAIPLLSELPSLTNYQELLNIEETEYCIINSESFLQGIVLCNFLKTDVTSKEANGCLLEIINEKFSIVNTDSSTAVKYTSLVNETKFLDPLNVVISLPVINAIRSFLNNDYPTKIIKSHSKIILISGDQTMIAPVMSVDYLIANIEEFFSIVSENIATLELKPLISSLTPLVNKSSDAYLRLNLKFDSNLEASNNVDQVKDIPCSIINKTKISVNGSYFLSVCQKLLSLDLEANLYFEDDTGRITLTSPDGRLMALIQGLS